MYCSNCGKEIDDKAGVCVNCGHAATPKLDNYEAKKHWWFWFGPVVVSILFCWTLIIPIALLGWTALRWKLDKIEYKDGCLYSRMGVIFIDKKAIPLERISMVSEKTDIIAELLGFGSLAIQSSASDSTIVYPCIQKPTDFINFLNKKIEENKKN